MTDTNTRLLDALTREGVLINASVRFWRGCKKLQPEDLGLQADDISERLIRLGHKRLLPKDATADLALIESRVHALIGAGTFPFLGGLGHFLPNAKLTEVTGGLAQLESAFWQAKAAFIGQYARLRASAMEEWRQSALRLAADPAHLLAAIEGAFPASLERHFGFEVRLFQIAVPGGGLSLELTGLADQENIAEARRQAASAAAEKIRADTGEFVAECVASLRQQTAALCQEMLASMEGGKTAGVHQKTLNRLIRFIDEFKQLNFANDTVMAEELERVRRELLSTDAGQYRDSAYARERLVGGLSALRDKARELARADTGELVNAFGRMGSRRFHLAA